MKNFICDFCGVRESLPAIEVLEGGVSIRRSKMDLRNPDIFLEVCHDCLDRLVDIAATTGWRKPEVEVGVNADSD